MPIKSVIKYPGGKFKLLDIIFSAIPEGVERNLFVDAFAGSGVVGINATQYGFRQVWLNDLNQDLANLFECLKQDSAQLRSEARALFVDANRSQERYCELRAEFNLRQGTPARQAALYLYLNKHGFNGLSRYNAQGGFNVPYSKPTAGLRLDEDGIVTMASALQGAKVTGLPFEQVLAVCGPGAVVYADPPYSPADGQREAFTAYNGQRFGLEAHQRLVRMAEEVAARGACVLISNHDTEATRALYQGADTLVALDVARRIAARSGSRGLVREVIAVYAPRANTLRSAG